MTWEWPQQREDDWSPVNFLHLAPRLRQIISHLSQAKERWQWTGLGGDSVLAFGEMSQALSGATGLQ